MHIFFEVLCAFREDAQIRLTLPGDKLGFGGASALQVTEWGLPGPVTYLGGETGPGWSIARVATSVAR